MSNAETRTKHIVLYDGECSLCTFQSRMLTWLDWLDKVRLVPISDPLAKEVAPGITEDQLSEAIHCVTPEGEIYRGARCIRFVGMRMPLLVLPALVLWIPGVIWVAEKMYQWVSRNRYLFSKWFGCKEACSILPSRRRAGDKGAVTGHKG